ncbi:MAG: hypothetical protein SF052_01935 [Bacteroidia bacterium]|nr:hypothetical protein [Bacteroidia bacterium]
MKNPYRYFQILSLDVVVGALASGGMAAQILQVAMPSAWWWALPISVWVIYTADHLLDAHRLKEQAHTERHLFHYRYFRVLSAIWMGAFVICIALIPFLVPLPILEMGLIMGGFVAFHLGLVQWVGGKTSWLLQKELGVALIYAAGVWGGPLVMTGDPLTQVEIILFLQFFLIALINLMIFSLFDLETDTRDRQTSFVRAIGAKKTIGFIFFFSAGVALCGLGLASEFSPEEWAVEAIYGAMVAILLLLVVQRKWFGQKERYRVWGDGVFFLPFLIHFF